MKRKKTNPKPTKTNSFTLIELLVVLLLFSIATTTVGWGGWRLWQNYQFNTHTTAIVERLKTIQLLSMMYSIDLEFELFNSKQGVGLRHVGYESLPVVKTLELAPSTAVKALEGGGRLEKVHLRFFHDGWFEPNRRILLSSDTQVCELDLTTPLLMKEKSYYIGD